MFAATAIVTVPEPVPDAPAVMRAHDTGDEAVHAHAAVVVTAIVVVAAPAVSDADVGSIAKAHGAAACVIV